MHIWTPVLTQLQSQDFQSLLAQDNSFNKFIEEKNGIIQTVPCKDGTQPIEFGRQAYIRQDHIASRLPSRAEQNGWVRISSDHIKIVPSEVRLESDLDKAFREPIHIGNPIARILKK